MNYKDFFKDPSKAQWVNDILVNFADEKEEVYVLTYESSDGIKPYETIVYHPKFNKRNTHFIVVDEYTDKDLALEGHEYWEAILKSVDLPVILYDVSTNDASKVGDKVQKGWRENIRKGMENAIHKERRETSI